MPFHLIEEPPQARVVDLRGIYLSLDPYMRGRIGGVRSYAAPVELGAVIEGVEGLDNAPEAFIGLLQGRNFGKLLVKLGDDPGKSVC